MKSWRIKLWKKQNDELKRLEFVKMNEKADNAIAVAATVATVAIPYYLSLRYNMPCYHPIKAWVVIPY